MVMNGDTSSAAINLTNGGSRDCGRFFLDVVGQYSQQDLHVQWDAAAYMPDEAIRQEIDKAWDHHSATAQHRGVKLYNGPLCRLIDFQADNHRLNLVMGPTCFKDFLGTNLTRATLRYLHGSDVLANPVGVSAAVVTSDNFILLGRRSQKVVYHGGRIHSIGGMVEPDANAQAPNPFDAIIQEITSELCVSASDIATIVCMGMVREKPIVQPELVFDVALGLDAQTLRQIAAKAIDADEHDELILVLDYPSSVITFVQKNLDAITPVCLSALLLHGLRKWGTGWFASARGYLQSVIS